MEKPNIIKEKSYQFAHDIVILFKKLKLKNEYVLSKQLLRAATSIGANIEEGSQAESRNDFIHKFAISQKESFEAMYWLRLLKDSEYMEATEANKLIGQCSEIQKIITAIIKTAKSNQRSKK